MLAVQACSATSIQTKLVQFKKGESAATLRATARGYQVTDYKVRANAGQTMTVSLKTDNNSNNFNVLPPGSRDVAIFIGSTSGTEWSGTLPADGDYTTRTHLERSSARRNEAAHYVRTVGMAAKPVKQAAKAGNQKIADATLRAGSGKFDARGRIACAQHKGQPTVPCNFGVARAGEGAATVLVTRPGSRAQGE